MKRLILASILSLTFAAVSYGQEKPQLQIVPQPNLLEFPSQPANPSVFGTVQTFDLRKGIPKQKVLELTYVPYNAAPPVCSVPLLDARVDAVDPGIAVTPSNTAVPIPQAHVPALACQKK